MVKINHVSQNKLVTLAVYHLHRRTLSVHGLGKWQAKFRTGKQRPGIALIYYLHKSVSFTEKRPRKPETDIKDGFENGTQISVSNIPSRKTGLSFYIPLLGNFPLRFVFSILSNRICRKLFFKWQKPLTLVSSSMFLFSSSTVWSWPFFAFVRLPNLDSLSSSLDPRSATSLSRRELTTDKSPSCFFKSSTYESNN